MKNRYISGFVFLLLGLLIAVGPFMIFKVCQADMPMRCNRTANAELIIGIIIAAAGIISIVLKSNKLRIAASIVTSVVGVIALLNPNVIIGVCDGVHMNCHAVTKPALSILSVLLIIAGIINAGYLYRKRGSE